MLVEFFGQAIDHGFASTRRYSTVCSGALVTAGFRVAARGDHRKP